MHPLTRNVINPSRVKERLEADMVFGPEEGVGFDGEGVVRLRGEGTEVGGGFGVDGFCVSGNHRDMSDYMIAEMSTLLWQCG